MVNNAMAAKLPTTKESTVCCPQELLVEGYDHVNVIVDSVAVKMLTTYLMHYASTKLKAYS